MQSLRVLIRDHRKLAMLIVALALCMKIVVPSGYMIGTSGTEFLTVEICGDGASPHKFTQITIPVNGSSQGHQDDRGKGDAPCPYSALSMASTFADAPLLAIALAFILTLGFAPVYIRSRGQAARLRPPLRGPPALA